mmetsp:Transcript_14823/g.22448  ORF Transcript_14823/g.22448 Transcript_14823/m.22448 type:complete len:434 (-) Transcript_14823:32-1333(-)
MPLEEELADMTLSDQLATAKSLLNGKDDQDQQEVASLPAVSPAPLAQSQVQSPGNRIVRSIHIFESLQNKIHSAALYSKNESLADINTSSLSLLSVEYHLGKAYLQLRFESSKQRLKNVTRAIELFHLFLSRCHNYESLLSNTVENQYSTILSVHESHHGGGGGAGESSSDNGGSTSNYNYTLPPQSRDDKIQNYKLTKTTTDKISMYKSKIQQRQRLSITQEEVFDGYDYDTLYRTLCIDEINLNALDSLSEIYSSSLELQMLNMQMQAEERLHHEDRYRYGNNKSNSSNGSSHNNNNGRRNLRQHDNYSSNKPMTLTHVTQDPVTNQLLFQKEVVQKTIFRPSWNQPTMSLAELAEREVEEAKARSDRQKRSEEDQLKQPRRYELLVKDGLEDDAKLVDASAKVDREWDDWKDDNPRGSGNKMGDLGDRNF